MTTNLTADERGQIFGFVFVGGGWDALESFVVQKILLQLYPKRGFV